jgi:hypothetical protein
MWLPWGSPEKISIIQKKIPTFAKVPQYIKRTITTSSMKLKYIFTILGVMLLGLTSCGKKDTPKTASNNPFAGTQWEYILSSAEEQGEREVTIDEVHFLDETHLVYQHSYKVVKKDGSIKESSKSDKIEATYTYNGLVATSSFTVVDKETGKQQKAKLILTMDEAKQKLTGVASSEGEEDQTIIFTRKK